MIKFRRHDPELDDPSSPLDWRIPALIIATLFLNFPFWYSFNLILCVPGPLIGSAAALLAGTLVMTVLFLLGPMLATQAGRRSLFDVAEGSLGSVPAAGLRVCCVGFLACWMSALVGVILLFISGGFPRDWFATWRSAIAGGIVLVAFGSGLQSSVVRGKLARFTNRLAIAILVAALLRVRDGWPAIGAGFQGSYSGSFFSQEWQGLTMLSFYAAPLALLAANFGRRSPRIKHASTIAIFGFALPIFGGLFIIAIIDVATKASRSYRPSLDPNIGMALWADVASSYQAGLMMLTAITVMGSLRFGAGLFDEAVSIPWLGRKGRSVAFVAFVAGISWLATPGAIGTSAPLEWFVTCLTVACAVLTVDFATARWRVEKARKIDWVGTIALVAGTAAAFYLPEWIVGTTQDRWWHAGLLPSYTAGFVVCLTGRAWRRFAGGVWLPAKFGGR